MPNCLVKGPTLLVAFLALGPFPQSRADFIDDFNSGGGGVGALDYTGFANWNVTAGSVDLIGNGFFHFYPGSGLYVDLNGTTGVSGTLTSKATFDPGTYNFSFSIGNNSTYGVANTMTVSLGSYSETFSETGAVPLQAVSRQITLTTPSHLAFATPSGDTDDTGVIIDNVSLVASPGPGPGSPAVTGADPSVPEPGSVVLMGVGTLSLLALHAMRRWVAPGTARATGRRASPSRTWALRPH